MGRKARTEAERRIPSRIGLIDGGVMFVANWEAHALQRAIDRARTEGCTHIRLNQRVVPLDRLDRVVIPEEDAA